MKSHNLKKLNLPDSPGVYIWKKGREVLYIGKATSLRDRVRSYFSNDLIVTRGLLLVDMVNLADKISFQETDSVLEALILESTLIKKYKPKYNTQEKDDRSYSYVIITKEDFSRVLIVRGREIEKGLSYTIKKKFGPFTQGGSLKEALKIVRKLFPFRTECKIGQSQPCFNYQIGLCPGCCIGAISKKDYANTIRTISLFLSGRKNDVIKSIEREMKDSAKGLEFEKAAKYRQTIFALNHIQDVSLIKEENIKEKISTSAGVNKPVNFFRIEAYDVSHLSGQAEMGVMVVSENGRFNNAEYRLFSIKNSAGDDLAATRETLSRRLKHLTWPMPTLIVVDGDQRQIDNVKNVLREGKLNIEIVSVIKDEKHHAKTIIGKKSVIEKHETEILAINAESHRFAINAHRRRLRKNFLSK